MSVLKVFNSHLSEFLTDVSLVFPDDVNIGAAKFAVATLQKVNPKKTIAAWRDIVLIPYADAINKGDFDFFIAKDYGEDVTAAGYEEGSELLSIIETIRAKGKGMSDSNKEKSIKYVQNLTKLCRMYFNNTA